MKVMTVAAAAAICASMVFADDVDQLKNLPSGVQSIKYDNSGVISTMVVVGEAAVPKALRRNPGKAAEYAGNKARDNARFEFTRFLSTKCKWGKNTEGETVMKDEAASATDTNGQETSAEASSFTETEMTKEEKAQSAQACVSGIQALWEGMNDNGEYTWVGAWNAKALKHLKDIARMNNEINAEVDGMGEAEKAKKAARDQKEIDEINGENGGGEGSAEGVEGKKNPKDPDVLEGMKKPKSSVAKGAEEFL